MPSVDEGTAVRAENAEFQKVVNFRFSTQASIQNEDTLGRDFEEKKASFRTARWKLLP